VEKAPEAFRTISEVAEELDVPQHVLRFWESRFHEIRPMKRGGGRRYYRPQDVDLLRGVRHLLYGEGYTIRGVQRLLREQGHRFVQNVWQPGAPQPTSKEAPSDEKGGEAELARAMRPPSVMEEEPAHEDATGAESPSPGTGQPRLSPAQAQTLRAALQELAECRRLLDAAVEERS
jgi:DNA-binding transcriptional MerR regulator